MRSSDPMAGWPRRSTAFEPRAEQAALAARGRRCARVMRPPRGRSRDRTGKSLAYLIPALASGQRVVVATATKALQAQLLDARTFLSQPPRWAAPVRVAVLKGRQNYLCRSSQGSSRSVAAAASERRRAAYERLLPLDRRRPRPATGPSSTRSRRTPLWAELAVGPDRCLGRRCPLLTDLLRRGRARAGGRGRARDREPRALLRRPGARGAEARRPARARRGHLRRGAPAGGIRGDVARRPRHRAPGCAGSPPTSSASCREAQPQPPGAAARPSRARGRALLRAVAPPTGRRRLREPPDEPSLVLVDALAASRRRSREAATRSTRSPAARSSLAEDVEAASSGDPDRVVWSEPGRCSRGRPWTSPSACASSLWDGRADRGPRLGHARVRPPSCARRLGLDARARARPALAVRLPRPGAPLRAGAPPRPARDGYYDRPRTRSRRSAASPRTRARPHLLVPGARRARVRACAKRLQFPVLARATRRASGCSSASAPTPTRSSSRPRRSGRGSTSRASRSRSS